MLKKVVVVYPCYSTGCAVPIGTACMGDDRNHYISSTSERTFEGKSLEVVNTDVGNLIIKEANGSTYAVFKHWIYWENIE